MKKIKIAKIKIAAAALSLCGISPALPHGTVPGQFMTPLGFCQTTSLSSAASLPSANLSRLKLHTFRTDAKADVSNADVGKIECPRHTLVIDNYFGAIGGSKSTSQYDSAGIGVIHVEHFLAGAIKDSQLASIIAPFSIRILPLHEVKFVPNNAGCQTACVIINVGVERQLRACAFYCEACFISDAENVAFSRIIGPKADGSGDKYEGTLSAWHALPGVGSFAGSSQPWPSVSVGRTGPTIKFIINAPTNKKTGTLTFNPR